MTITEMKKQFASGSLTPSEALTQTQAAIEEKDGEIKAFLEVFADAAESAAVADDGYKNNSETTGVLAGVPLAIKNNIMIAGKRMTAASKILADYVATYDATVITRLKEAGAVLVGATNLDEFAMGSSTENSAFGPTKNPVDLTRVPGGSSGGSAAAVAMGAVPGALGTDTGGSIRQPASFCGLVGFKPTYGAVSRYGLAAMGSSLDQAGPLTHTVADAELIHTVIAGHDQMDATTIKSDTYPAPTTKDSYTIGVPRAFLSEGVDPGVMKVFEDQLESLAQAGHTITDVSLELFETGLAAYYISMPAEVSSNLARYDGMRYGLSSAGDDLLAVYQNTRGAGFGDEVKRRILLGTYVLSSGYYDAYYGKAEVVRQMMRDELDAVFSSVDMITLPTAPSPAFKFGEHADPVSVYKQDIFTVPVNLTGVPAISLPIGSMQQSEGPDLPVGVQYIAPHGADSVLFDFGKTAYDATL